MTKTQKKHSRKTKRKLWVWIGISFVLAPLLLTIYGAYNKDEVLNLIKNYYEEHHTGTLSIDDIKVNALKDFPNLNFKLKGFKHTDFDTLTNHRTGFKAQEAEIVLNLTDVFKKNLKFKKIRLKDVQYSSTIEQGKPELFYKNIKMARQNRPYSPFTLPAWLHEERLKVDLQNVSVKIEDQVLNKNIHFTINNFRSRLNADENLISGRNNMDVTVHQLGFNLENGSYLNNALIKGSYDFNFDLNSQEILVSPFDLLIDKQRFLFHAKFKLSNKTAYQFDLVNETTDFSATRALLPDNIASKLNDYAFDKTLKTHLTLKGFFSYRNNPNIAIDFSTENNIFTLKDATTLTNFNLSGSLTNNIHSKDSVSPQTRDKKDLQINFNLISGDLKGIDVLIDNAVFRSTPVIKNYVEGHVRLKGKNEDLANALNNTDFYFQNGDFSLDALVEGDIAEPWLMLNHSIGNFKMSETAVFFRPTQAQLPINNIHLQLNNEFAEIMAFDIPMPQGNTISLKGRLKHLSSLVKPNRNLPLESDILLHSKKIDVDQFLQLITKLAPKQKSSVAARKNLHTSLAKIYRQFHPSFAINLEELIYQDHVMQNVSGKVSFLNEETLNIDSFGFTHEGAALTLNGDIKIPIPKDAIKEPVFINFDVKANGVSQAFNNIFKTDLFRFDKGAFSFNGHISGNIHKFSELLNNASGTLIIDSNILHYEPAQLDIIIDNMLLHIEDGQASLDKFEIDIGNNHKLKLSAKVKDFPSFMVPEAFNNSSTYLLVESDFIDLDALLKLLDKIEKGHEAQIHHNKSDLYQSFKDIYDFNPVLDIEIGALKYQDLTTQKVSAQIYFENASLLKIDKLSVDYKNSNTVVNGAIKAHNKGKPLSPKNKFDFLFSLDSQGDNTDLNDYFGNSNFLFDSGKYKFTGTYSGQSQHFSLEESKATGRLQLTPSIIEFKSAGLFIPIDTLDLAIKNNEATVNSLQLRLKSNNYVRVSGQIDNFSGLISKNAENHNHQSNFIVYSPHLTLTDINEILESAPGNTLKNKTTKQKKDLKLLKKSLLDLKTSFNPELVIKVDRFEHQNILLKNFETDLLFDNQQQVHLKNTGVSYKEGDLKLGMSLALNETEKTFFKTKIKTHELNIGQAAKALDYFEIQSLKEAKTFEAILNSDLDVSGYFDEKDQLDFSALNGFLNFRIDSLKLYEFRPIIEHVKVLKKERFKMMSFQPIDAKIKIKNGMFSLPRTEIQSSAIHFYVEGALKPKSFKDIWISIPTSNLKHTDGIELPDKVSYDHSGSKIYYHISQDINHKKEKKRRVKGKLRLSNRKLRKGKTQAKHSNSL
ncbi:hypothetical protein [Cognatitamlana onchidii]|uniref:hypothetical protein n=1 Tax=Cognatitamlana onchidii TaxID=2562860 RepID=UPI0010A62A62|nr:hypothetical protein [Algibacter onchidii]